MIKAYITRHTFDTSSTKQIHDGPCVIYAINFSHTAIASCSVYNENVSGSATGAYQAYVLRTNTYNYSDSPKIPNDGFFFSRGLYLSMTAGIVTVMWYPA